MAEQFTKGGLLTLDGVSAVGVLGMGVLRAPIMGGLQDKIISQALRANHSAVFERAAHPPREVFLLGSIRSLDEDKVDALTAEERGH